MDELYSCLCVGDAEEVEAAIEQGLTTAATNPSDLGERGRPILKAARDVRKALAGREEVQAGTLVLHRVFDEPLPLDRSLVDRGIFLLVGGRAGASSRAASLLIGPAEDGKEVLIRRFLQTADKIAKQAAELREKVKVES